MAKIHSIQINNFKGIQAFYHLFADTNFACIIGRGDSCKTTILEAISLVLSPSWNIQFCDTDFHNCNINEPIIIESILFNLPEKLIAEHKFGLHTIFIDNESFDIKEDVAELEGDNYILGLKIRLTVTKSLEPKWMVLDSNGEEFSISANDRASLNVFLVSDYIDRHFSWTRGTPLYSLLNKDDKKELLDNEDSVILNAMRSAKSTIDNIGFEGLDEKIEVIKNNAEWLGVNTSEISTTIDFKDLTIKDGRVCLHDNLIPLRLKGKGSKRLLSVAVQLALLDEAGILLIDEIEQGLEPDRIQNFISQLKATTNSQIFITTHSRDAIVELDAINLHKVLPNKQGFYRFEEEQQGAIRRNPEVFFAKKVIACEGATEVGFIRAINEYLKETTLKNLSLLGYRTADCEGANMVKYCENFQKSGYQVILFCDSDDNAINRKKSSLKDIGVNIVDCNDGLSIEQQIFNYIPWKYVIELVAYASSLRTETGINQVIKESYSSDNEWNVKDNEEIRKVLGFLAKEKGWYKRIDHGVEVGKIVMDYYKTTQKNNNHLYVQIENLLNLIR